MNARPALVSAVAEFRASETGAPHYLNFITQICSKKD